MKNRRQTILEQIEGLLRDGYRDDHPLVDSLKQEYNQIMEKMHNEAHHASRDIMDVFPSEVSSQIISEALPLHGYTSALLLLTMVSSRWMLLLKSIPTLWAQVEICGWAEDSMAIIQTFKHLSCDAPLRLVICAPILHDLVAFRDILQGISTRLHQVVVLRGTHEVIRNLTLYSVLDTLLDSSGHIKGVESIVFYPDIFPPSHSDQTARKMTDASLPPNLRMMKGWCFHDAEMDASQTKLQCMEELQTCIHLDDMLARASNFPLMQRLIFTGNSGDSKLKKGFINARFFNLTTLRYKNGFTASLMGLLSSVAPRLLDLDLRVPVKEIGNIQIILEAAKRLRRLLLELDEWSEGGQGIPGIHSSRINPDPSVKIKSLRTLEILAYRDTVANVATEGNLSTMKQLLVILNALYSDLEVVDFHLEQASDFLPLAIDYFAHQPLLRICSLQGAEKWHYQGWDKIIILPVLEEFQCDIPVLENLRLPCLHSLEITWYEIYEQYDIIGHLDALFLSVRAFDYAKPIKLPPRSFPSLERLALNFGRDAMLFKIDSFHALTTISIITADDSWQATALCLAVIYDPEACPRLKEMEFQHTPPEWDILFIMLETRNFLKTGAISRIRRITVPLIPYSLRAPLASLLRGLFTRRPPNKEISFEAVREVMFDVNVVGCRKCLRNMISSCTLPVDGRSFWRSNERVTDTSIYSVADFPPPSRVEPHVRDWLEQRESLMQVWNLSIKEWDAKYVRRSICSAKSRDPPVEITEYDALVKDTS